MKQWRIRLLITDLDNTLYDWVSSFVPAFYGMVDVAVRILGVDREKLLDDLKAVHQRYRNSEEPFALLETSIVERSYPSTTRLERKRHLEPAFDAFNRLRQQHLRLYPGVRETLRVIRDRGCSIVGYTEAVLENSVYRMSLLGIIEELHLLYGRKSWSAEGHPDPTRRRILDQYSNKIRLLPDAHQKPDPQVLRDICGELGVPVEEALYVGDSITRDVAMATRAGVHAAWARYGSEFSPEAWNKLVRVTHWTTEDVAREKRLKEEYRNTRAELELHSFAELLAPDERRAKGSFEFCSNNDFQRTVRETASG